MKLGYLADYPEALPTLAEWYFREWGHKVPGCSPAVEEQKLRAYLNKHRIPLIVLAVDGEEVMGAAQLKFHEMDIYPEKEHWLGGVYVDRRFRGRGVAKAMIDRIVEIATGFGVETLYLQTEHLDGGLYARLGWLPVEQTTYHGTRALVMERNLVIP